ncbi:MAG: Rhomboid family protein [Rhodospirillales bacterium]|nr:Rhomboid family protein [Rhodospirillales bacterium]
MQQSPSEPALNLAPATARLILLFLVIHLIRLVLPDSIDQTLVETTAVIPALYTQGEFDVSWLWRPFTYMALHGGWLHLLVNLAMLAALGSGVERAVGAKRFLAIFFACGVAGAAAHVAAYPDSTDAIVGASGGISGLFAAIVLAIRQRSGQRLLPLAAIWIAVMVVTGALGIGGDGEQNIAWVAHVGGFVAGLILFRALGRSDESVPRPG